MMDIIFAHPWILAGFAVLPGLYYLLRIMPPAPKRIMLPTARFLKDLIPETQTPSHTPWWILLLRLVIAALVLIALAGPIYNPAAPLDGKNPLRLVIDNGWAGAQNWNTAEAAAEDILAQAARSNRNVFILATATKAGEDKPAKQGPLSAAEALSVVRGMQPQAWSSDNEASAASIAEHTEPVDTFWLGSGLDEGNLSALASALQKSGTLTYIGPDAKNLPIALALPATPSPDVQINLIASGAVPEGTPVSVQALAQNGRVLDAQDVVIHPQKLPATVTFDIPESVRGDVGMFRVQNRNSAGATFLLDDRYVKRSVGIVAPAEESESSPLITAGFYLKRALEPYAALTTGAVSDLLQQNPSVIVLPDIDALPADTMTALEEWVRKGGLLLRFAGPNMTRAEGESYLVPVPLRKGGRTLDGSMTWEQPQTLADFPQTSPFYGLKVPQDITVRQQILPEITPDLDEKTWARLADGTPLITASKLDRGMLVLVHTTATPEWSDLAVSGLYVDMLRRIVSMAGGVYEPAKTGSGALDPVLILDGHGAVKPADSSARSIEAENFADTQAGPSHPPGIYGSKTFRQALNIGDHISTLHAAHPSGATTQVYGASHEKNLMPVILLAALALLFADWFIMLLIAAGNRPFWRFSAIILLMLLPVDARADTAADLKHANGLYLAYIITGDASIDAVSQMGLQALSDVLTQRTAVEPQGVAGVNPEHDPLSFYPLIYWPVSNTQTALSAEAITNVQAYLDHGGTILFDTRDENYKTGAASETQNAATLRKIVGALNVPPLVPASKDHVLTKSFYLLDSFPGKYAGGTLWVEQQSASGRDGVSSVLIGGNDWAGAWAAGRGDRLSLSGGSRQQEMAARFGVNLVMYALTGNYKADQVHVPYILERLGR